MGPGSSRSDWLRHEIDWYRLAQAERRFRRIRSHEQAPATGGLVAAGHEAGIPLVGGVPSQRCRPLSWTVASQAGVLLALQDVETSVY